MDVHEADRVFGLVLEVGDEVVICEFWIVIVFFWLVGVIWTLFEVLKMLEGLMVG